MTTEAAARLYEAQHLYEMEGRGNALYNPEQLPYEELPVIYGFNNGGSPGWYEAIAMAEDGTYLGGHICSSEAYMPHDLGILAGTRSDRHETSYQKHYPRGYRMMFVSSNQIAEHEKLNNAFKLKALQEKKDEANPS
jgi:hypothetical protein